MCPSRSAFIVMAAGLFLSLAAMFVPAGAQPAGGSVIYVDVDAAGAETGASWADAYTDLQDALTAAMSGDEIWVAEGMYTPTDGSDRTISFVLTSGVAIYGGFNGTETTRDERDWTINESILSGDVGVPGDSTDNTYNVLTAIGTNSATVLDGFTVRHGKASNVTPPFDRGAGLYAPNSDIVVRNSTFRWNVASVGGGSQRGGAIYFEFGMPLVESCTFESNVGLGAISDSGGSPLILDSNINGSFGGGVFFDQGSTALVEDVVIENGELSGFFIIASNPHFIRTTIRNNRIGSGGDGGGGRIEEGSNPIFEDSVFEGNTAAAWGGGVLIQDGSSPLFLRTTFRENESMGGGGGAALVLGGEPAFIDCIFERNIGRGAGGALQVLSSGIQIINSHFLGNTSTFNGSAAGALILSGPPNVGTALLANVIFVGNEGDQGGAIAAVGVAAGEARLVNVTLAANKGRSNGGAIYSDDGEGLEIQNSILWGNEAPLDNEIHIVQGGPPVIERSIVAGGYPSGTDILNQNPLFVRNPDPGPDGNWGTDDDDYGDLRLREGSPGIDYGLQSFLPPDIWDLDDDGDTTEPLPIDLNGDVRVQAAEVDLGAYEGAVIVANEPDVPEPAFSLSVFPNPARESATLVFLLDRPSDVRLAVYDVLGREVARLSDGILDVGRHVVAFDASALPSGTYLIRMTSRPENEGAVRTFTQRITLLR